MRSIINLDSINKSLSGLTESVKSAQKQSQVISKNIDDRNKIKRNALSMSSKLFARRRDNQRRREKEDLLEASGVMGALKSGGRTIQRTTKGFLGRILDFVGTVIIGWTVINLPTIIKLAEGVMKRLKKYFDALKKFVIDTQTFFTDLGSKFGEIFTLVSRVNFDPFLKQVKVFMKRVQDAFTQIQVNTVRTVRKFLDKSDREIANEIGIGELYDNLDNQENITTDETEIPDDSKEQFSDDSSPKDLILQGLSILKNRQGGELTEAQQKLFDEGDYAALHEILINSESQSDPIILLQNGDGQYIYVRYQDYNSNLKAFKSIGATPVPDNQLPYNIQAGSASPITESDIEREKKLDASSMSTFNPFKDMDFDLPVGGDKTVIVPFDVPKQSTFLPNSGESDIPFNTDDINISNIKYSDVFKYQIDF